MFLSPHVIHYLHQHQPHTTTTDQPPYTPPKNTHTHTSEHLMHLSLILIHFQIMDHYKHEFHDKYLEKIKIPILRNGGDTM